LSGATGGTSTSPAPSLPRPDRPLVDRDPRVPGPLALPALPTPVIQELRDPLPLGPLPLGPLPLGPLPLAPDPPPLSRVEPA
jgi:hypothetical protein